MPPRTAKRRWKAPLVAPSARMLRLIENAVESKDLTAVLVWISLRASGSMPMDDDVEELVTAIIRRALLPEYTEQSWWQELLAMMLVQGNIAAQGCSRVITARIMTQGWHDLLDKMPQPGTSPGQRRLAETVCDEIHQRLESKTTEEILPLVGHRSVYLVTAARRCLAARDPRYLELLDSTQA